MIVISLLVLYLSTFFKKLIRLHHEISGRWLVYLKNRQKLTQLQKEFPKGRLELHQIFNDNPEDIGIVPFQQEIDYSNPKKDKGEDLFIYGSSSKEQTTIRVYFSRRPEWDGEQTKDRVKVVLELNDGTGNVYRMEEESVVDFNQIEYRASGFAFEILQANKVGRIKFRGYLRRNNEQELCYVQIRFLCLFFTKPYDHLRKFNTNFLAKEITGAPYDLDNLFEDKIEQFCQIKGTFKVEEQDETELFFLGTIGRRFLPKSKTTRKIVKIFGFDQEGYGFQIGLVTVGGLSYRYGFITRSGENFNLLKELSLSKEELKQIHISNSLKFEAKFLNESKTFNFEILPNRNNWKNIKLNGIDGMCYIEEHEFSEVDKPSSMKLAKKELPNVLVASLEENIAKEVKLSGGKGASLSQLHQLSKKLDKVSGTGNSFVVPKGLVVSTNAYQIQTANTKGFSAKIESLCKVAYGKDKSSLEKNCCEFVEWFSKQELEDSIKKEITEKIRLEFGDQFTEKQFAVRSSGAMEDSSEMSAAGQMTTYLGVRGLDNLFDSVVKCWASQFAFVPVEYKRGYGQELNSPMAVVIQEMVNCHCAGVIFTCNPTNGDERLLTITSNFGLGESVVSATADPDTFELAVEIDRNSYQHERKIKKIVTKTIGKKSIVTRLKEDGVEDEKIESGSDSASLNDELAIRLGQISLKIQQHYGNPRDIEWGIKDGQLYMFQSRPITNLDSSFTKYELMHENDTPHMNEFEIYSRAHWGENCPGSLSWIGNIFFNISVSMLRDQVKKGMVKETDFNPYKPTMAYCCNQLMFNMKNGIFTKIFSEYPNSEMGVASVMSFFGHELTDPDLLAEFKKIREESKKMSLRQKIMMPFGMFMMLLFGCRKIPEIKRKMIDENEGDIVGSLDRFPMDQKFDWIIARAIASSEKNSVHGAASFGAIIKNMILAKLLKNSKDSSNVNNDVNLLLSQCNDVVSAEVPAMIRQIAAAIQDKSKFQQLTDDEALRVLETGNDQASKLFAKFKQIHGHRGYREMDAMYRPWALNPIPCVQVIKSTLKGPSSISSSKPVKTIDQLLSEIKTPLSWWKKLLIKHWALPWCQNGVGYRENTKSIMIKSVHCVREAMWKLADDMAALGILPEPDLLFYLKYHELRKLTKEGADPLLVMKAKQRKRIYPAMDRLKYPEFIKGFRMKPKNDKKEIVQINQDSLVLKGTAVTVGEIKARVCVAETIEEAVNIQAGDILVTYSTDIGWSPYFPLISGIVTEIGGTISHGAVIAREFGIPSLIAVENACSLFKTGDIAYLDTKARTIIKIREDSK